LVLSVESSPIAAAYGSAALGVCHLIRGLLAGLASGSFGCAVLAREAERAAMGHVRCIISVRAA